MPVLPKADWCRACPGWGWSEYGPGQGFSSLEGYGSSGLFAVAEALGQHEEEDGLPLRRAGASGLVFRRALDELGIDSQKLTITNVIRCRPPGNILWGQPWTFKAIEHCSHYLNGAVAQRQPSLILALGDTPLQEMVADHIGTVSEMRGFVLPSKYGCPLISTYHPAYITRGAWHLYGAFKHDIGVAYRFATEGVPAPLETTYALHPSLDDVRAFLADVLAHPDWPISYDVETAHMLGEKEPEDWRLKRLVQIQFSVRSGQAIVLPWDGGVYSALAKQILSTANPKWGWNSARSDDIILRANGCTLGGELHDLMLAWAHLQPDFTARGDDRDGDEKGIPAKLMGLQSAASFYCPELGPWKHLAHQNLQLYGAYDADRTTRCGIGIFAELESLGLMAGYREHKYELRFVLDDISEHGLPVDRTKQAELRVYTLGELYRIQTELHAQVPFDILGLHPPTGYKALHSKVALVDPTTEEDQWQKTPLKALLASYDPSQPPLVCAAGKVGYLKQRQFELETLEGEAYTERRWCIERLYNPHGSSPNTKAYIRAMGYKMPTHIVTGEDTTGKTELLKLAKETGDEVLLATYTWRDLAKTGRDYTTGKWVPGEDGRVHGTLRCGTTGSGQTSCTDPNIQQFPEHTGLAKRAKEAIRAERGHVLVKVDMRGFHSRAIGWIANDPLYYQLADEDVHSFITAHFLHLPDAPYLMEMSSDERRAALAIVKREHSHVRNYKIKRCIAEGQMVLTSNGLKPIQNVMLDDAVWDGIEWVSHEGVVYKGERDVTSYDGLTATPDHEVFTNQGRKVSLWFAASTQDQLATTESEGQALWAPDHNLSAGTPSRELSVRKGEVCPDWRREVDLVGPYSAGAGAILQERRTEPGCATAGIKRPVRQHTPSLQQPGGFCLCELWRSGDSMRVWDIPGVRRLYASPPSAQELQRVGSGSDQQQRQLQTRQLKVIHPSTEHPESAQYGLSGLAGCQNACGPVSQSLQAASNLGLRQSGHDGRGDHREGQKGCSQSRTQLPGDSRQARKVRVYDILNAGPRHRFTVSGKLVSNCVHGRQFNMGVQKLYQLHGADFDPPVDQAVQAIGEAKWFAMTPERQREAINDLGRADARRLYRLFDTLFPKTFVLYLENTRELIYHTTKCRLTTPFGHHRFFWGWDMEQAAAFRPSNCAHCHIQSALIRLRKDGALRAFGACNFTHDALWLHPTERDAEECVATVQHEFELPSTVMVDSPLGPFQCNSDAEIGPDLAHMETYG